MKRFERYVLTEILTTAFGVTLVLLMILVANQFARILGDAASGDLPQSAILPLLGLSSITYLTVLVPIAFMLSVMLALGRLYHESEVAAAMCCGLGPKVLARPAVALSVFVALVLLLITLHVSPWAQRGVETLKQQAREQVDVTRLAGGKFTPVDEGRAVVYAERIEGNELSRVFMQRTVDDLTTVVVAERGEQMQTGDQTSLVLYDGERFEGEIGQANVKRITFEKHSLPFSLPAAAIKALNVDALSLVALVQSPSPQSMAELQWRLSPPLMTILLAWLAVSLARTKPRQGRYARVLLGVVVYLVYANVVTALREALEGGDIPAWIGVWPAHIAVGVLAWWMLRRMEVLPAVKQKTIQKATT